MPNDKTLKEEQEQDEKSEPEVGKGTSTEANPPSEVEVLKAKLSELEQTVEQYRDQLLRKAAEFENYKKRVEADYLTLTRYAAEDIIVDLLPILDDLARSLKAGKERREFGPFFKGVELIHSKLMKILESRGLKSIESLGKPFDVGFHDALMQMPKENVADHTVIEEVEKGYLLHDKVIRHAKVIVAGNSQEQAGEVSENKDDTLREDESTGKEDQ
jgi:molecular chaperone GrpE